MFVAHLPAGYLLTRLTPRLKGLTTGILIGSVAPDLDMLWFYFVDGRAVHHHEYLTHRPALWALIFVLGWLFSSPLLRGLAIGGMLHMVLDSLAGGIAWGWPFSSEMITLVDVPASQSHWILSFVLHWTFLLEIVIVGCAIFVFAFFRRAG